jgi:ribonuclease HI
MGRTLNRADDSSSTGFDATDKEGPMPWVKMRFKDQLVWVHADDAGRPVLDGAGRAEMKYRESDEKSYRPAPGNLQPAGDSAEAGAARPSASSSPRPRSSKPAAKPAARALPSAMAGAVEVWTDGACSGNPGPMGIGVVVLADGGRKELGEYLGIGTNNIAELTAIERGLDIVAELPPAAGAPDAAGAAAKAGARRVRIYSDSGYAIGLLDKGWKAKANQELVARLRKRVAAVPNIEWVKVPGHAGVPENERCDQLARDAIQRALSRRS